MDKNKLFGGKQIFKGLGVCAPWKKFGQKMKNFKNFFDIIDYYACLYKHVKFHQNRSKFGCIIARFSKMPRHGISIFAIFNHLRVIFEWGNMFFLLSFFSSYLHLRLTVSPHKPTKILNKSKQSLIQSAKSTNKSTLTLSLNKPTNRTQLSPLGAQISPFRDQSSLPKAPKKIFLSLQ